MGDINSICYFTEPRPRGFFNIWAEYWSTYELWPMVLLLLDLLDNNKTIKL